MHPNDRRPPYIGITGFMTADEISKLRAATPNMLHRDAGFPHVFMCGILASWKSLAHQAVDQPGRYPKLEDIHRITLPGMLDYGDYLKVEYFIHYNSKQPELDKQLRRLKEVCGRVNGFQLNIVWPVADELKRWREDFSFPPRLVIQVSRKAYEAAGATPQALVRMLRAYDGVMTDILYDMSGGRGVEIDPASALPVLEELHQVFGASTRIGVAGGLGPETLWKLEPLIERYPGLSIDAEGRLRDPATDALDHERAKAYLTQATRMFDAVRRR